MIKYIDNTVWGPWGWHVFHNFSLNNTIKLTKKNKSYYYEFYKLFGNLLPCPICKSHYNDLFNLSHNFNRKELIKWTYNLHQDVNIDLEKKVIISYQDFLKKYTGIEQKIAFQYFDIIFLVVSKDISLIELNNYINFLKLIILLYPNDNYRNKYLNYLNLIEEIGDTEELIEVYLKIKSIKLN